jgi:CRP-like cAMP-binding protein
MRALGPVSEAEVDFLRTLAERRERHVAGDELASEGGEPARARLILSGWACRQRVLPDGRRQIFAFLLPGDAIGLNPRQGAEPSTISALTAMETVEAEPLAKAVQSGRTPGLARALVAAEAAEHGLLLDHMVRLGRQTAYERVAHFLVELQRRLEIVGLGDSQRFPLPLTQEILADALGLSIVHVNRTLQQLRREQLIELRSGVAILLEPETLASIAGYRQAQARPAGQTPASAQMGFEDSAPI